MSNLTSTSTDDTSSSRLGTTAAIAIGAAFGVVVVSLLVGLSVFMYRRGQKSVRPKDRRAKDLEGHLSGQSLEAKGPAAHSGQGWGYYQARNEDLLQVPPEHAGVRNSYMTNTFVELPDAR